MTRFTAKALSALDWIYRFIDEPAAATEFELDGAIIPVHNVAREAEVASGLGGGLGFASQGTTDVHAGAGTINTTFDPYDLADAFQANRQAVHVWAVRCYGSSSSGANFAALATSVSYPVLTDVWSADDEILLFHANNAGIVVVAAGRALVVNSAVNAQKFVAPLFIPLGATVNMTSTAQVGAATIRNRVLFWIGARGVLPPGLA